MKSADDRYNPKSCRFSKEWVFLQAFLTALALNTELGVANDEIDGISNVLLARLYALFAQIEFGIRSRGFFLTVLTAVLFVDFTKKEFFFDREACCFSSFFICDVHWWYGVLVRRQSFPSVLLSDQQDSQYSTACRDVLFLPSCDRGDALHAA